MSRRYSQTAEWISAADDRISALPDFVLWHILSFLPTKSAVATSVLSKRWRPLWYSLHTLDFDDETFPPGSDFRHFVYSVFLSRNTTQPIRSFRLKLRNNSSSRCDHYDINRFVYFVTQKAVKYLTLDLFGGTKLPPCVFTTKTLVVLKLKMLIVDDVPYVKLPKLKTLHLNRLIFGSCGDINKLLSGCPVLEDLEAKDLVVGYKLVVDYDYTWYRLYREEVKLSPNLVRAHVSDPYVPFSSLYNAEFLRADMKNVKILNYDLPTFANLIHLELAFKPEYCHGRWEWVLFVLQHCPKLQELTILDESHWMHGEWEEPQIVAECLSSKLRTCSLKNYKGTDSELQFAKCIMQNSKVLHNMTIKSSRHVDTYEKLQMLMKLSLCQRGSTTCKLLFK